MYQFHGAVRVAQMQSTSLLSAWSVCQTWQHGCILCKIVTSGNFSIYRRLEWSGTYIYIQLLYPIRFHVCQTWFLKVPCKVTFVQDKNLPNMSMEMFPLTQDDVPHRVKFARHRHCSCSPSLRCWPGQQPKLHHGQWRSQLAFSLSCNTISITGGKKEKNMLFICMASLSPEESCLPALSGHRHQLLHC